DRLAPDQLAAATSPGNQVGDQAETESPISTLREAIQLRYQDLYAVGWLAETGQRLSSDSELFDEIQTLYPELFRLDDLALLGDASSDDSPLALLSEAQRQELLRLQELDTLAAYGLEHRSNDQTIV